MSDSDIASACKYADNSFIAAEDAEKVNVPLAILASKDEDKNVVSDHVPVLSADTY